MRSDWERREGSLGQAPVENQGSQSQEKIEKKIWNTHCTQWKKCGSSIGHFAHLKLVIINL